MKHIDELLSAGQKIGLDRQATLYEEQPTETYPPSTDSADTTNTLDAQGYYNDSTYQYEGYDYSSYGQEYASYNYDYNYDYNYGYNDGQATSEVSSAATALATTITTTVAGTTTTTTSSTTTTTSTSNSTKLPKAEPTAVASQENTEGYGYYDDTGYYYNGQW